MARTLVGLTDTPSGPGVSDAAADDCGADGVVQYVKLDLGADGVSVPVVGVVPVIISGTPAVTGPLTDAQLRATPVSVSGTVATGALTDAQLRAAAVPVSFANPSLTAAAPTTASVGVASAEAVPVNANRKGLVLVNLSDVTISIAFGVPAVLNSGITMLSQGGSFTMTKDTFTTAQVRAIAGGAAAAMAVQEFA